MASVIDEVNNASRRVRVLEDRYTNLRNKPRSSKTTCLRHRKIPPGPPGDKRRHDEGLRERSDLDTKTGVIVKELQLNAKKKT